MNIEEKIKIAVEEAYEKAEKFYKRRFERSDCRFDLTGAVAGKSCTRGNFYHYYRFNKIIASENEKHYLAQTCPHEVAHRITDLVYGRAQTRPHGREWKHVMTAVMQIPADRCHSYSVKNTSTGQRRRDYIYNCGCQSHALTGIRHKKIIRQAVTYACKKCKNPLQYSHKDD